MSKRQSPPIDATTTTARWRLTCPNGHTSWETTNYHFWCHACSQQHGIDPEFSHLFDTKTGELVPQEGVIVE